MSFTIRSTAPGEIWISEYDQSTVLLIRKREDIDKIDENMFQGNWQCLVLFVQDKLATGLVGKLLTLAIADSRSSWQKL
jgi:hypothetical protein